MSVPRVVIAGTGSGVGKTTVATGLMAALRARGLAVAGFKVGPDFIDPSYHQLATGRPARNLDAFLSGEELIAPLFAHGAAGADVAVVEGVMGLYDGAEGGRMRAAAAQPPEGGDHGELASTAQVAKLLDAPVVLVVDAGGMARSVAALVHGYATFDPQVRLAGVIANRVGSDRHAGLVREALAPLEIPVLGTLTRDHGLETPSRHLGLVPVAERRAEAARAVAGLGGRLARQVDLDALLGVARSTGRLDTGSWTPGQAEPGPPAVVGVAGGPAFTFVYTENLELLGAAGAHLVTVDPLVDERLPDGVEALYLGGGFPEEHVEALSDNAPLRAAIAAFAACGRPVLAECGGLLYLCRSLDGRPMCGVLDAEATMTDRLSLGYREATASADSPWWTAGQHVRGHEFHYSAVQPRSGSTPAWTMAPHGAEGFHQGSAHASYLHTHWAATPHVAGGFVAAARRLGVAACS